MLSCRLQPPHHLLRLADRAALRLETSHPRREPEKTSSALPAPPSPQGAEGTTLKPTHSQT